MAADFSRLQDVFRMLGPADLAGTLQFPKDRVVDRGMAAQLLELMLAVDARGVLSAKNLRERLGQLVTNAPPEAIEQFFDMIRFHSTAGFIDGTPPERMGARARGARSDRVTMHDIVGAGTRIPAGKDVTFVLSDSPYIHPTIRDAGKVEVFMSGIPTLTMSRCVPYLDVEFQFDRSASTQLQAPGLLKFLLGAQKIDEMSEQERAMVESRRTLSADRELDYAGMEMFTSPQTLVNAAPVVDGARYVPVMDPLRPFASLESFEITVRPTVGTFTYKTAHMSIKLHDRSRLAEISDLIKPDVYTRTTVWVTYGWRHPSDPDDPYANFINSTMLAREAYGIINSSFKFEATGQVSVNLELFTRGISELRTVKISESPDGPETIMREIRQLADDVARHRRQLRLDPPEGIGREIRPFQILDAAERGEFPDLKAADVRDAITRLRKSLGGRDAKIDQAAADDLTAALKKLYSSERDGKFDFKSRLENTVASSIRRKFDELERGLDPFLPGSGGDGAPGSARVAALVDDYNREPSSKTSVVKKSVASFAKMFAVFMAQPILTIESVDEVQVFFYAFNDQAGALAGTNIGSFPIDLPVFFDQYREHVTRKWSESITLDEFIGLVVNAQVDDPRAIGYGMRKFFEPYDPKNREPQVSKKMQGDYESALAAQSAQLGPFKKPSIELYVETVPEAHARDGDADIAATLSLGVSSRDDGTERDARAGSSRRIMRIHVYDKQLNPYKAPALIMRAGDGRSFVEVATQEAARKLSGPSAASGLAAIRDIIEGVGGDPSRLSMGSDGSIRITRFGSNQQVKDAVSRTVPTIVYGSNASAVISAELSSKQDPLLSTVQMQRAGKQNTTSPNGSGVGGLPLRIVPASLTMPTFGCPLVNLGQLFFVDFGTGTTADNLYILTGLTHSFQPGKFETSWTMTFYDAYGRWEGSQSVIDYFRSGKATESS